MESFEVLLEDKIERVRSKKGEMSETNFWEQNLVHLIDT